MTDVDPAAIARVREHHPAVGSSRTPSCGPHRARHLAPCALGGALDDEAAETLRAGIVCGGANNQLAHDRIDNRLAERGIIYCPDYLVNAGGVIQVADELHGFSLARPRPRRRGSTTPCCRGLTADAEGIHAGRGRRPPRRAADGGRSAGRADLDRPKRS